MSAAETIKISAPDSVVQSAINLVSVERAHSSTYPAAPGGGTWTSLLFKEVFERVRSNQGLVIGRQVHPFDFAAAVAFLHTNEHHATCIHTKVSATVGLGYKYDATQNADGSISADQAASNSVIAGAVAKAIQTGSPPSYPDAADPNAQQMPPKPSSSDRLLSKADMVLDPLCRHSWNDVINSVGEDFWELGNGYLEVVREWPSKKVIGLHHIPAPNVFIYLENSLYDYHFEIISREGAIGCQRFARFGDSERLMSLAATGQALPGFDANQVAARAAVPGVDGEPAASQVVSEVIHFRRPTGHHRWYGMPDWLSAVPAIELCQCLHQYKYDFFLNRGVPEFMLFVLGQKLAAEDWKKIETAMKANIGVGNSHKSIALNIENPEVEIKLEKLAMEGGKSDDWAPTKEQLSISIVTAHRVPPLLAGILIPGKLGSNNELPNAMMAFQALVIGPAQRVFHQTLGKSLGGVDSQLGLKITDFECYTILDEINVSQAATIGGMKQPLAEAQSQGRDMSQGMKQ